MKKSPFPEVHIIAILREYESGVATAKVCRRHCASSATFYKWKAKCGGLDISKARRLRGLENKNCRLKRMLADAMLDNAAPTTTVSENGTSTSNAILGWADESGLGWHHIAPGSPSRTA